MNMGMERIFPVLSLKCTMEIRQIPLRLAVRMGFMKTTGVKDIVIRGDKGDI